MRTARSLETVSTPYAFDSIVVGLHLRWDGVYQRPQHLLSRFSRSVPILIVEEPHDPTVGLPKTIVDGNITILRPIACDRSGDAIDARTVATVRKRMLGFRPLLWLYTPMMVALADAFPDAPVVFDAMDELAQFAQADPRLVTRERAVLDRAAMVFCGGPSLYRSRAGKARNVRLYASGVDVAFFEQARSLRPHAALAGLPKPVFGYVGVIDERIDLALIAAIAEARPDATIAMIGPTAKIDAASLPRRANIVYLGKQAYSDLPALLAGIDVALMPFALNESTHNISPTKTLEYLAAAKPVVSTAVPDVVSEYASIITIAGDTTAFIAALLTAANIAHARQPLADERTHAATWDAIAAAMLRDLGGLGLSPTLTTAT